MTKPKQPEIISKKFIAQHSLCCPVMALRIQKGGKSNKHVLEFHFIKHSKYLTTKKNFSKNNLGPSNAEIKAYCKLNLIQSSL